VKTAEEEARRRGAVKVHSVSVSTGFLTGVVPELLHRAYEMAREGTLLRDAELRLEVEPVRARCAACGRESVFESYALACPVCGAPGMEVLSGDDILLRGLDLEVGGSG
jgi:hydrogenase nickel incorporation protein HypA/HybF